MELKQGWLFHEGDVQGHPERPAFDPAGWAKVEVPHTWNHVGFYLRNEKERANKIDKYQGASWYRLTFTPPAIRQGQRAFLQFDAASRIATVWLNGIKLGTHDGGFSRFRFDATAALRPNRANVLTVKVDNSKPTIGATTQDVLPLAGDFFVSGGLYRPVSLILTGPVHFDMLDSGGPGIYASTSSIGQKVARIQVRALLRNDATSRRCAVTGLSLVSNSGETVARSEQRSDLPVNATKEVEATLDVPHPQLWQGVTDPYLYKMKASITACDGRPLDSSIQNYGIRQMRFDPQKGFFLNGKHLQLHGVGYHQGREGKGWAVDRSDIAADLKIMRDMGVNTIRLAHYQHGQAIHDLADQYGIILWDEIPLVSVWTLPGSMTPTKGLVENAKQQLRELIRQNYNHASVADWGIANEVDFGNSLPSFLTGWKEGTSPDPFPLLNELQSLAHAEDPSRPTALATCCEGRLFARGVEVPITAKAADLGGANRYFGWYFGKVEDLSGNLDLLHKRRPLQPLAVTEYGAGGAITLHTDNVMGGPVDSRGRNQPEEYESYIHEKSWSILNSKPYLWSNWIWNAFDFPTTIRKEGDSVDINTKGLVTFDRKTFKDAYFFYKANWTGSPTVHINARRYINRAYAVTDVRVYSNSPSTELLVNGRSNGSLSNCVEHICVWKSVRLAPGDNAIVARGQFGSRTVSDSVDWKLSNDAARTIRIDSGALVAGKSSAGSYGSDNFFSGGTALSVDSPADFGKPPEVLPIANTQDRDIVATYRSGSFSYDLPVTRGRYEVQLVFVAPSNQKGGDRFNIIVNGKLALANFDILAEAGKPLTAVRKTFNVNVAGDGLKLSFQPVSGDASVSAIEVSRLP